MKQIYILFLFITSITLGQQQAYYTNGQNNVDFTLTGLELKAALSTKISNNTSFIPYSSSSYDTWDALKQTTEDPSNASNVLLVYNSGSVPKDNTLGNGNTGPEEWNREHVFARSRANPSLVTGDPGPGTDINNLLPSDPGVNSDRGSLRFIDGSGGFGVEGSGWYPGDQWKGDVARIAMYMYLRYDGDGSSIAETLCLPENIGIGSSASTPDDMIDLFLDWNAEDPVSSIEDERNSVSETRQGNRNPFIDNPYIATLIWGGPAAEDRWGTLSNTNFETQPAFSIYPNPTQGDIQIKMKNTEATRVEIFDILGKKVLNKTLSTSDSVETSRLKSGVYIVRLTQNGITETLKLVKR